MYYEAIDKWSSSDPYLEHHGVKGMKWGVRKEKRANLARRLVAYDYTARRLQDKYDDKRLSKKRKLADKYYDENNPKKWYRMSDKFDNHTKKVEGLFDTLEYIEDDRMQRKIFLDKEIRPRMKEAKKISDDLDKADDKYLNYKSDNYKQAYKKYVKSNPNISDPGYGFDHYTWRPGNADYDAAKRQYNEHTKSLRKQYSETLQSISRDVLGKYSSQKIYEGWNASDALEFKASSMLNDSKYKRYFRWAR